MPGWSILIPRTLREIEHVLGHLIRHETVADAVTDIEIASIRVRPGCQHSTRRICNGLGDVRLEHPSQLPRPGRAIERQAPLVGRPQPTIPNPSPPTRTLGNRVVTVCLRINPQCNTYRIEVSEARCIVSPFSHTLCVYQNNGRKNTNDGEHDEKLDEREAASLGGSHSDGLRLRYAPRARRANRGRRCAAWRRSTRTAKGQVARKGKANDCERSRNIVRCGLALHKTRFHNEPRDDAFRLRSAVLRVLRIHHVHY